MTQLVAARHLPEQVHPFCQLLQVVADGASVNHAIFVKMRATIPDLMPGTDTSHQLERAFFHGIATDDCFVSNTLPALTRVLQQAHQSDIFALSLSEHDVLTLKEYCATRGAASLFRCIQAFLQNFHRVQKALLSAVGTNVVLLLQEFQCCSM